MNKFSKSSRDRLSTCHPDLVRLFTKVLENYDCSILCGYRSKEEQNQLFNLGKSQVEFPNSKHNAYPSNGVDVAPSPVNWESIHQFYHFDGFVKATAVSLGIEIRSGSDWNMNNDLTDQTFFDLVHYELVNY